jgi:hypothetical protein
METSMPLFLQALPLSLKTFWRYLLLLPVLTAMTIAVALVASYIPIIGFIVPGVMSVLCTLAGLRCALVAHGHDSEFDLGKLLHASFGYFLLGIVGALIAAVLFASLGQLSVLTTGEVVGPASTSNSASGIAGIAVLIVTFASVLFMCALAVPMTAAAATATTRGVQSDLFWGFGSGIVSLAIVSALGVLGNAAIVILFPETWMLAVLMFVEISQLAARLREIPHPEIFYPLAIGSLLFPVWTTSWFFATAVLAWESAKTKEAKLVRKTTEVARVSTDDLRALRESRMPDRRGPPS